MSEFDPGERPSIVSLTDRVKPVAIGAVVTSVHFLGDRAAFVGAEENVSLVDAEGAIAKVATHGGGILCAVSDGKRLITGGDDGKVVALDAKGNVTQLAADAKRRWIDNVAVHPDGAFAWSAGKTAFVKSGKGEEKTFDMPSTVGGLAFAPKGLRVAVAHYGGVTLWFPNMAAKPDSWNGPARISGSSSRRTTNSWSLRCTSRRCMAGGSPTTGTCACPAIPAASGRCRGARAGSFSRPPAPTP